MGKKLGRRQPRAGLVGRLSRAQRQSVRLPAYHRRWGKEVQSKCLSCNVSDVSAWFHWGDSSRERGYSHGRPQSPIRDQQEDQRKRQIAENSHDHAGRTQECASTVTAFSRMQSMDDEKAPLQAAKWQFYPCKVRLKNRGIIWDGSRKISRRSSKNVWTSCRNGSRQTRNWNHPTLSKPKQRKKCDFGGRTNNGKRQSCQPGSERQAPCQTRQHNKTSCQC